MMNRTGVFIHSSLMNKKRKLFSHVHEFKLYPGAKDIFKCFVCKEDIPASEERYYSVTLEMMVHKECYGGHSEKQQISKR